MQFYLEIGSINRDNSIQNGEDNVRISDELLLWHFSNWLVLEGLVGVATLLANEGMVDEVNATVDHECGEAVYVLGKRVDYFAGSTFWSF